MTTLTTTQTEINLDLPVLPPEVSLLERGREYLAEPRHWCRGKFTNGKGAYCAYGVIGYLSGSAIGQADDSKPEVRKALNYLNDAAATMQSSYFAVGAMSFNDRSTRKARVLKMFDKAIEMARKGRRTRKK
jgi:hypothetical protein